METSSTNLPQGINCTYPSQQALKEEKAAKAMEALRTGFTRLPNEILMQIVNGNLSKAEIKIILLIARYTISFEGRKTASLSKADIERYTGLQGKTILGTISDLEAKKLIVKIKGDQYTANQLGLIYDTDLIKQKKTDANQEEAEKVPEDKKSTSPSDLKSTHPSGENGTHPADTKSTHFKVFSSNDILKDSLSKMQIFENYFSQIRAPKKAQKERECFFELLKRNPDISEAEWIECFWIVSKDCDAKGNKIKAPMMWLSQGFDNYLARARSLIEAQKRNEKLNEDHRAAIDDSHQAKSSSLDGKSDEEVIAEFNAAWEQNQLSFVTDRHLRDISEKIIALMFQCASLDAGKNGNTILSLGSKISELKAKRESYLVANPDLLKISIDELDEYLWNAEKLKNETPCASKSA